MGRGLAQKTIDLRNLCYDILEEIQPATVRAVCYALFTRKAIPSMAKKETAKISRVLTRAREAGLIPYEWIVDENRDLERKPQWDDPADFTRTVKRSYRRDLWNQQPQRVEIWSEKGTMRGTLAPVLDEYGVGFRVMHGFTSTTVINDIAEMTRDSVTPLRVFYIGDWDPSGMYMSSIDMPKRLWNYGARVELTRLALDRDDTDELGLALSFAATDKRKDPRYRWFTTYVGDQCWEVDAINPSELRDRVENAIASMITDAEAWNRYHEAEQAELASLEEVLTGWSRLKSA
ncbi:MAG: hypothetical protein H0U38_08120 [Chloroflexia bacterium]|nr:hypothetical protein [Chloroflexia bacterium]